MRHWGIAEQVVALAFNSDGDKVSIEFGSNDDDTSKQTMKVLWPNGAGYLVTFQKNGPMLGVQDIEMERGEQVVEGDETGPADTESAAPDTTATAPEEKPALEEPAPPVEALDDVKRGGKAGRTSG